LYYDAAPNVADSVLYRLFAQILPASAVQVLHIYVYVQCLGVSL